MAMSKSWNPLRTQVDVSALSGSVWPVSPVRNSLSSVSSPRHGINSWASCGEPGPGPLISISSCRGSPVSEMQDCFRARQLGHKGFRIVQVDGGEHSGLRSCFQGLVGRRRFFYRGCGWISGRDWTFGLRRVFSRYWVFYQSFYRSFYSSWGWIQNGFCRRGLGYGGWGWTLLRADTGQEGCQGDEEREIHQFQHGSSFTPQIGRFPISWIVSRLDRLPGGFPVPERFQVVDRSPLVGLRRFRVLTVSSHSCWGW